VSEYDRLPCLPSDVHRVHLTGGMIGHRGFNHSAFHAAAAALRAAGAEVYNPAEFWLANVAPLDAADLTGLEAPEAIGVDQRAVLAGSIQFICSSADAVAVLPGWSGSRVARVQVDVALAIGVPVICAETGVFIDLDSPDHVVIASPRHSAIASERWAS
jgi:hypothetical protein